jgi:osmotically inducible protein OsmC
MGGAQERALDSGWDARPAALTFMGNPHQECTMPTRNATARWEGGLMQGKGSFKGESEKIGGNYSFGTRFGSEAGTNPEELLAAAEAACFSMALGLGLEQNKTPAERIDTRAACTIDKVGDGFAITRMALKVHAKVPGIDRETFSRIAQATKDGCPVSKALKGNVALELEAVLEA